MPNIKQNIIFYVNAPKNFSETETGSIQLSNNKISLPGDLSLPLSEISKARSTTTKKGTHLVVITTHSGNAYYIGIPNESEPAHSKLANQIMAIATPNSSSSHSISPTELPKHSESNPLDRLNDKERMRFWECYIDMWKNTFLIDARTRRREYILALLASCIILFGVSLILGLIWGIVIATCHRDTREIVGIFVVIICGLNSIAHLFPICSIMVRRSNDMKRSFKYISSTGEDVRVAKRVEPRLTLFAILLGLPWWCPVYAFFLYLTPSGGSNPGEGSLDLPFTGYKTRR